MGECPKCIVAKAIQQVIAERDEALAELAAMRGAYVRGIAEGRREAREEFYLNRDEAIAEGRRLERAEIAEMLQGATVDSLIDVVEASVVQDHIRDLGRLILEGSVGTEGGEDE